MKHQIKSEELLRGEEPFLWRTESQSVAKKNSSSKIQRVKTGLISKFSFIFLRNMDFKKK